MTIFPSGSRLLQPVGLNRHSAIPAVWVCVNRNRPNAWVKPSN